MKRGTPIDRAGLRRLLAPLKPTWERQAARIDALSLRERIILFLCLLAVLGALFDAGVLSPSSARASERAAERSQQSAELDQLRQQFMVASGTSETTAGPQRRLEAALAERARLDDALRHAGPTIQGDALPALLQRLLARQPGLVLERLRLLGDEPAATPGAAAASAPRLPDLPGMTWQGVELQVQGPWADAQRYLHALEAELPGLRWGEMRLTAGAAPQAPRLEVQVFLLKVRP